MISVTAKGLQRQLSALDDLKDSVIKGAVADALNWTSYDLRERLQDEMKSVFERPTRFTINSIRVKPAKPERLEATVRMDDENDGGAAPAAVWTAPNIFGRPRRSKGYEKNLRARGILPQGMSAIPGAGMRRTANGTVSRGHINQMLSGLGAAESVAGYQANATNSKRSEQKGNAKAFFLLKRAGKPVAIAERRGKALSIVMAITQRPLYSKIFDFYGISEKFVAEELPRSFDKAIARRLRSSKR